MLLVLLVVIGGGAYLFDYGKLLPQPRIGFQEDTAESSFAPAAAPDEGQPARRIYPYSVVPGGVADEQELRAAAANDEIVAQHYSDFDLAKARVVRLSTAQAMYVSYRVDGQVYWTRHRVSLPAGETVITDGSDYARTRCGNRLSQVPRAPTNPGEPPPETLDTPMEIAMSRWPSPLTPPDPIFTPEMPPVEAPPIQSPPVATNKPPFVPFFPPIFLPTGHKDVPVNPQPQTPVPEPSTIVLVGGGLAALWAAKRRRKQP